MALVSNALTTVATLATELGIDTPAGGSADEQDLERRIAVASGAIERYCRRSFAKATTTERVKGYGTQVLMVKRTPILSVTSVHLDDDEVDAELYETDYTDGSEPSADAMAGFIRRLQSCWEDTAVSFPSASGESTPGTEEPRYTVVYVGGYVLPKDATEGNPRTLPYELEQACIEQAVYLYRTKGRDRTIASEALLSASVSYRDEGASVSTESGLLASVETLLKPFRRWD